MGPQNLKTGCNPDHIRTFLKGFCVWSVSTCYLKTLFSSIQNTQNLQVAAVMVVTVPLNMVIHSYLPDSTHVYSHLIHECWTHSNQHSQMASLLVQSILYGLPFYQTLLILCFTILFSWPDTA